MLAFTDKALSRKVKYIVMKNIQGFEDVVYELPQSGMVRLAADSEVGKSIVLKALNCFVLGHIKRKDIRESLVRDSTNQSLIGLTLYNGVNMYLVVTPTQSMYGLKMPTEDLKVFPADTVPQEILDELGFYVNLEHDICLNVRENEPLALVHTDDRTNSALFNCVLENPALEKGIYNLEQSLVTLNAKKSYLDLQKQKCLSALEAVSTYNDNIDELNRLSGQLDTYLSNLTDLHKLNNALKESLNLITSIKLISNSLINTAYVSELVYKLTLLKTINSNTNIDELIYISNSSINNINEGKINRLINLFNSFNGYKVNIVAFHSIFSSLKEGKHAFKDYHITKNNITTLHQLKTIVQDINDVQGLHSYLLEMQSTNINKEQIALLIQKYNQLMAIRDKLNTMKLKDLSSNYSTYLLYCKDVTKLKAECGVCPLCGQTFKGGAIHEHNH